MFPAAHALPGNRWDLLDGVEPDPLPAVSVVVAHYRQPRQLALTLAALAAQDYPADLVEVIVADDGSPEPPSVPDGVRVVRHDDRGFRLAAVRNLGAAHATGDVLVFLDADTVPEPGFVRAITRLPALAPDGVVVGRRRHADLSAASPSRDIRPIALERMLPEPSWLRDGYERSHDLLHADDRSYRFFIGAVLSCSRAFFAETGGFDETFDTYGGEDWEWAYRCWIRGAVFAYASAAVAWHDGPDAADRSSADRAASDMAVKNAEAIRLADLIPVEGSRPWGRMPDRVDVAIDAPQTWTAGQRFVVVDRLLAALPASAARDTADDERVDRVRVTVQLLEPFTADAADVRSAVDDVTRHAWGVLVLVDEQGAEVARVVSERAAARARRWDRTDLFPTERRVVRCRIIAPDVSVEAYLGGWGDESPER